MKKISLSVVAMLIAGASFANVGPVHTAKKAKHATCTSCPKGQKCTKATCGNPAMCCK